MSEASKQSIGPRVIAVTVDTSRRIWNKQNNYEEVPVEFDYEGGGRSVMWMTTANACKEIEKFEASEASNQDSRASE